MIRCDVIFQVPFELKSELKETEHVTSESLLHVVTDTLSLDLDPVLSNKVWKSSWMLLRTAAAENSTQWQVQFMNGRCPGDVGILLRCMSLHQDYSAAVVRLVATMANDPHNWAEIAAVLQSGDVSSDPLYMMYSMFLKRLYELGDSVQVKIKVRWKGLQPSPIGHQMNYSAPVQYKWQISNFNAARPNADCWQLWSELLFGKGAVWRMCITNGRSGNNRQLWVGVQLQHVSEEVEQQKLQWSCTLNYICGNTTFTKDGSNMTKQSNYRWKVLNIVDNRYPSTVGLIVSIACSR